MDTDEPAASALVILRTDAAPDDDTARPDPASARQVRDLLRSLGFEVGALIGTSFSITAPIHLFRRSFGNQPPIDAAVRHHDPGGTESLDLSTERLPVDAAQIVRSITFTSPPDFGPTAP